MGEAPEDAVPSVVVGRGDRGREAGRITDEDTETGYVGNIFEAYDARILRDDGSIGDCGTGELIINGSGLYTSEISAGGKFFEFAGRQSRN